MQPEGLDLQLLASAFKSIWGEAADPETLHGLEVLRRFAADLASEPDSLQTAAVCGYIGHGAPVRDNKLQVTKGVGPQMVEGIDIPDRLNVLKRGRSYFPKKSPGTPSPD
ncbi:hypothetical protein ACKUFS_25900 [Pseudomonas cannabina]|uniref:hypothetical protein n=1 Tax=Pseudomonas syringae group TaxID=136849 RepID=UPI0006BA0250|nr:MULTISPECIES: hypothetical protein [Pseudomonas syringae group]MCH5531330.1 hypothetical protein [Pseudomonas syringae pv. syringae]MCH5541391.1 hypothetical protein [Pseudomonas syringae pv. syringae]MCH5546405.1 hypothetical protein [Pseudomonas syringae pv. syringae]MCH5604766.1 hypothetical protein [Pseudomonas syringae pv. syringae]MCH5609652.1 hypothetical protein [Pseudomonas syringae pv. syringae]